MTEEHILYAIYRNGEPIKSRTVGVTRNAFDRKGSAKGIITALVEDELRREMRERKGPDYYKYYDTNEAILLKSKIREQFEIKEFVAK